MKDEYDKHIEVLLDDPSLIQTHWLGSAPLFKFTPWEHCPTTLMLCLDLNEDLPDIPDAVKQFMLDAEIPSLSSDITVEDLPFFADVQRFCDTYREQPC